MYSEQMFLIWQQEQMNQRHWFFNVLDLENLFYSPKCCFKIIPKEWLEFSDCFHICYIVNGVEHNPKTRIN